MDVGPGRVLLFAHGYGVVGLYKLLVRWLNACRSFRKQAVETISRSSIIIMTGGFEADSPDIAIPITVAQQLNLWPPDPNSDMLIIETGGGEVSNPYYLSCAELDLVLEDRILESVRLNIVVNPHIDEVVLSDYVTSELGITPA